MTVFELRLRRCDETHNRHNVPAECDGLVMTYVLPLREFDTPSESGFMGVMLYRSLGVVSYCDDLPKCRLLIAQLPNCAITAGYLNL